MAEQRDHERRIRRLEQEYAELRRLVQRLEEKLRIAEEAAGASVHWRPVT